ncbi:MAG: hypothetical protein R3F39_17080 [Myxococcota bacterium]
MTPCRPCLIVFALCLAAFATSCDTNSGLGGLIPDKSDFDFSTSCKSIGDVDQCSTCCEAAGFDTVLVATGDCGCAYVIEDAATCDASKGTSDACFDCCEAAGASGSNRSSLNGEATCTCFVVSKTKSVATGCVPDCAGAQCGSDGCGGSCGSCAASVTCSPDRTCGCVPDCAGAQCGSDGCGGSCGSCGAGETCSPAGTCGCVPDCAGAQCGSDGCGGSCGSCGAQETCTAQRTCFCAPACAGNPCGDNGCGGSCGTCSGAYTGTMTIKGQFTIENTGGPFTCTSEITFSVTSAGKISAPDGASQCQFTASGSNQPVIISVGPIVADRKPEGAVSGSMDVKVQAVNLSKSASNVSFIDGTFLSTGQLELALKPSTLDMGSNPKTTAKIESGTFSLFK